MDLAVQRPMQCSLSPLTWHLYQDGLRAQVFSKPYLVHLKIYPQIAQFNETPISPVKYFLTQTMLKMPS